MKLFKKMKDGGPESTVTGYWLIEAKSLFSIALLRFDGKSREAFHNHAFNCISWVLSGNLTETMLDGRVQKYSPSWKPFITTREDFHKVDSDAQTFVLTFRGPWAKTWNEFTDKFTTLTSGRKIIG